MKAMRKSIYTAESSAIREILRSARRGAGISQRDLAARLRVSPSWVAKVETGERRLDLIEFGWFILACEGDLKEGFATAARVFLASATRKRRASR